MKHYGNAINALTGAVILALNPYPSLAIDRVSRVATGGGTVRGTGAYTGQTDATYDIEIVNDTITGTPRVSAPTSSGVGNATIAGVTAAGGVQAQSFVVTLADLGSDTRSAYTPFQGVTLRAKSEQFEDREADANSIAIEIGESGLVRTPTDRALLADLTEGSNEYIGAEWDFGGRPRNPDGTIQPTSPRISFGDDPTVYRQYKVYSNGGYVYSFTPAPLRTIAKGARVKAVSGGRTITVTHVLGVAAPAFAISTVYTLGQLVQPITPNGHWYEVTTAGTSAGTSPAWPTNGGTVTSNTAVFTDRGVHTNTYTDIVTLFDALTAINGNPNSLIEVVEPVVNDFAFGGMGITDLVVRTGAYVQTIDRSGTDAVRSGDFSIAVAQDAPTEDLTIRCSIGGQINRETWEVRGSVSGLLAQALTGVPYNGNDYDFTIPLLPLPDISPIAEKSTDYTPVNTDTDPVVSPCISNFVLGAQATARTFNFKYEKRGTECDCDGATVQGGPNPGYLGNDPGGDSMDDIPTELQTRIADIWDYYSGFVTGKTSLAVPSPSSYAIEHSPDSPSDFVELVQLVSAEFRASITDIAAVKNGVSMFASTLYTLHAKYLDDGIPSGVTTAFDAVFDDFKTDFDVIDSTYGDFWRTLAQVIASVGSPSPTEAPALNRRLFTQEFSAYMQRYKVQLETVLIAAGIQPDFDSPTDTGTGPWVDHNEYGWFVATDSELQPIQPGWYYHSAVERTDDDGNVYYESTQQFGIGVAFGEGCRPAPGDVLTITIGETGTTPGGYQQGDRFDVQIVSGSPVQLGGGQTGDDTQVWSVVGSVAGALDDYDLVKSAPAAYSDGGIGFTITPGAIDSRLGDAFTFFVEGGEFRWRKNAGSWTSATPIAATVSLDAGVIAAFDPGAAPSFVAGDAYSIKATAVNGGEHLQSLTYGGIVTTVVSGKHVIDVRPVVATVAGEVLVMFRDPTEVGATVTVRGFTSTGDADGTEITIGTALTNGSRGLRIDWSNPVAVCAKFTVTYTATVNTPTTIGWQWMFIGQPFEMPLWKESQRNIGEVAQQWSKAKRAGHRSRLGVDVSYDGCSHQGIEDLRYLLDYADLNDDSCLGIVVSDSVPAATRARDDFGAAHAAYPVAGIVRVPAESLDVTDVHTFQPINSSFSLLACRLSMQPA